MLHVRLFRSTPFRLALTFGVLFILAFLVAGTITYALLRRELNHALDVSVHETYSVVASTYLSNDLEDLTAAVSTYAGLSTSGSRIFLLLNQNGKKLAGNIPAAHLPEGFSTIAAGDVGLHGDDRFRTLAGDVGGNRLIVGESYAETEGLEQIALASFGWASFGIVAVAVMGGTLLAARAQTRLDGIERAMSEVSSGNLSRRIPLRGNGDDIDVVATHMNHALNRLSALVDSMRQVSADIAHDLKTPLNRLKMTIEQAIQQSESDRSTIDLLMEAREEADHINATFEALLRISQIEAGARKTRFRSTDLMSVVASVAEIYRNVAVDAGQTLRFEAKACQPMCIQGDRELLTQMFVNLIENAITHCPKGTILDISLRSTAHGLLAAVSDNGAGIPQDEHRKVFQRLYRLDKSRTTPGSGLGLSLVKAIAELHGAEIWLEDNRPGLRVMVRFATYN